MADEKRIGLQIRFRGNIKEYEKWKEEWRIAIQMVRLGAAKRGIDLASMELVGKEK